ncbi:MAG: Nodulation protein D 2 [Myxococcota bacterium]|nr:Nodulation protein D 2 [Myxococcota bacterium]
MEHPDLNLLAALDALLQEGSVTGAARRLGLSTPAMSHTLARIRSRVGDPVLVRSGRGMVLTPRAREIRARVHEVVSGARNLLEPETPINLQELDRTFQVHASDYVLAVIGQEADRIMRAEAPGASLRILPNGADDALMVREGASDLAIGIYGDLPQEMRSRVLLTDRFVCLLRKGHPAAAPKLTLEKYVALPHVQVAPRGRPGGYIDDILRQKGLKRRVMRAVPFFHSALQLVSGTDYVLTVPERIASAFASRWGLEIREFPARLRPYALSLIWHPRFDNDSGHRFLRDVFVRAAAKAAGDRHDSPRTRLDAGDPASGQLRKRPRLRNS